MKKLITLSWSEEILLNDVLEYLLCDDKEKEDFADTYGEEWFDDEMQLKLNDVPLEAKSHIYYKAEKLRIELLECMAEI